MSRLDPSDLGIDGPDQPGQPSRPRLTDGMDRPAWTEIDHADAAICWLLDHDLIAPHILARNLNTAWHVSRDLAMPIHLQIGLASGGDPDRVRGLTWPANTPKEVFAELWLTFADKVAPPQPLVEFDDVDDSAWEAFGGYVSDKPELTSGAINAAPSPLIAVLLRSKPGWFIDLTTSAVPSRPRPGHENVGWSPSILDWLATPVFADADRPSNINWAVRAATYIETPRWTQRRLVDQMLDVVEKPRPKATPQTPEASQAWAYLEGLAVRKQALEPDVVRAIEKAVLRGSLPGYR